MTKRINLDQFAQVLKALPQEITDAAIRGCKSAAMRGVGFVVEEIQTASPRPAVNTAGMLQSVRETSLANGARLAVDAPHAAFIEFGTRPFFAPIGPLFEWAKRRFSVDDEAAMAIAYAVRHAISKNGIRPRWFFKKAMKRVYDILGEEIERELNKLGT